MLSKFIPKTLLGLPVSFPPSWRAPRLSSPVALVRWRWPTLSPHWLPSLRPPYPPTYPCLYCGDLSVRVHSLFQQLITTFIKNYSLTVLSERASPIVNITDYSLARVTCIQYDVSFLYATKVLQV